MFESRRTTIPFQSHLNNYYCDEKKGSYGLQCLDAYSYGATRIDDSLPRKEKDPRSFTLPFYINSFCFENTLADLRASVSVIPFSTYLNLGLGELAHTKLTVELAYRIVKYPKGIAKNLLVGIDKFGFPVDFIILDMPEDVKVPLILRRPFLSTAHAKIDVFKRKITLRVGDEKIIFKSIKPASSLIKRVYMLSLRERMELDLEARLMGETLVLNRSLDPLYGDYIELNDLNVPLELKRDQVDDLIPTIKEGEVIDDPMIDIIKTRNNESFDGYPSFCEFDRKIHIDCAYNLRFSCMIVVENMDGYRDQDMGDIIFGEPFCKASCVEARRFNGLITIHNGNDYVTYQMARSHPRSFYTTTSLEKKSTKLVKYQSSGILLIMEYLVKISKKARILELKRRHLKITVLTSYKPYPSRKIRRICACTSQETTKIQRPIRRTSDPCLYSVGDQFVATSLASIQCIIYVPGYEVSNALSLPFLHVMYCQPTNQETREDCNGGPALFLAKYATNNGGTFSCPLSNPTVLPSGLQMIGDPIIKDERIFPLGGGLGSTLISSSYSSLEYSNSLCTPSFCACLLYSFIKDYNVSKLASTKVGLIVGSGFVDVNARSMGFSSTNRICGGQMAWASNTCMLRLSDKHYKTDIKFHGDMNFNMARYSVNTCIFGIRDRHLDNLLLRDDGCLFHFDFGYIVGCDPKPFHPSLKLCKDMVEAMAGVQ
ncbi:retrovirus-related pol polyprotein from transposon TNT 1-94, partial [Tanacetum coccineum]